MLCIEGLARALKIFLGKETVPQYKVAAPQKLEQMIIKPEVLQIRPHVVCAVLRNLKFTEKNYKTFIDLQEKLHQNVCRYVARLSVGNTCEEREHLCLLEHTIWTPSKDHLRMKLFHQAKSNLHLSTTPM